MNNILVYTSFCFYILESQNGLLFFTDSSRWELKYGLVYYTKVLASLLLYIHKFQVFLAFREKSIARYSEYNENILLFCLKDIFSINWNIKNCLSLWNRLAFMCLYTMLLQRIQIARFRTHDSVLNKKFFTPKYFVQRNTLYDWKKKENYCS